MKRRGERPGRPLRRIPGAEVLDHRLRVDAGLRIGRELAHRRRAAEPRRRRAQLLQDLVVGIAAPQAGAKRRESGLVDAGERRMPASALWPRKTVYQTEEIAMTRAGEQPTVAAPLRYARAHECAPEPRDDGRAGGRPPLARDRTRRRDDTAREAALEARSRRHRPLAARLPARSRSRLGYEREDHDDRDGSADPRTPPSSRLEQLRREPRLGRSPPPCLRRPDAELGVLEVDEFALPEVDAPRPAAGVALGNLFRDQLDRYGELEHIAERWRAAVSDLDRERSARRRTPTIRSWLHSLADDRRRRHAIRHRRSARRPPVAPARGRLEVLPSLRPTVALRRGLRRAPRRLPLRRLRRRTAAARRRGPRDRARGLAGSSFDLATTAGTDADRAAAARPLQRLQRARRGVARTGSGRDARRRASRAGRVLRRLRPAGAHGGRRPAACSCC